MAARVDRAGEDVSLEEGRTGSLRLTQEEGRLAGQEMVHHAISARRCAELGSELEVRLHPERPVETERRSQERHMSLERSAPVRVGAVERGGFRDAQPVDGIPSPGEDVEPRPP